MEGGFIKIWRKMLDSEVMQDDWLCRLWMWCMLKAQWQQIDRNGVPNRGQFYTGRIQASGELGVPPSKWYRGIEKLRDLGCIAVDTNSNRTTITVCNYATYQDSIVESEQQVNSNRTASEQLPLEEEGKKARNSAAAKDATNDDSLSPAWLARKWVDRRRGTKGRDELDRARTTFEEMIRLGCNPAKIAAEIDNQARRRTEPVWEMEERVMRAEGIWKDKFAGHSHKTSLTEAAGEMFEWAKQREANDLR